MGAASFDRLGLEIGPFGSLSGRDCSYQSHRDAVHTKINMPLRQLYSKHSNSPELTNFLLLKSCQICRALLKPDYSFSFSVSRTSPVEMADLLILKFQMAFVKPHLNRDFLHAFSTVCSVETCSTHPWTIHSSATYISAGSSSYSAFGSGLPWAEVFLVSAFACLD